jgi:hypothetical protein
MFLLGGSLMALGFLLFCGGVSGTASSTVTVGWSSFFFSLGALTMSAGFMVRAREIEEKSQHAKDAGGARHELMRVNGPCSMCKSEPAIIRCNLHNSRLCGTCLAVHDSAWCEYVPCGRKSTAVGKGAWR